MRWYCCVRKDTTDALFVREDRWGEYPRNPADYGYIGGPYELFFIERIDKDRKGFVSLSELPRPLSNENELLAAWIEGYFTGTKERLDDATSQDT